MDRFPHARRNMPRAYFSTDSTGRRNTAPTALLVLAFVVGPLAWLTQLAIALVLVPLLCPIGRLWPLTLVSSVVLAATLLGAILARKLAAGTARESGTRFLAKVAVFSDLAFAAAIVATAIPVFSRGMCAP